jgi:hypothetical protein
LLAGSRLPVIVWNFVRLQIETHAEFGLAGIGIGFSRFNIDDV